MGVGAPRSEPRSIHRTSANKWSTCVKTGEPMVLKGRTVLSSLPHLPSFPSRLRPHSRTGPTMPPCSPALALPARPISALARSRTACRARQRPHWPPTCLRAGRRPHPCRPHLRARRRSCRQPSSPVPTKVATMPLRSLALAPPAAPSTLSSPGLVSRLCRSCLRQLMSSSADCTSSPSSSSSLASRRRCDCWTVGDGDAWPGFAHGHATSRLFSSAWMPACWWWWPQAADLARTCGTPLPSRCRHAGGGAPQAADPVVMGRTVAHAGGGHRGKAIGRRLRPEGW